MAGEEERAVDGVSFGRDIGERLHGWMVLEQQGEAVGV